MLDRRTRRILPQEVIAVPICRGPDRPGSEPAAAVGTDIVQYLFDARHAERTFIGTNPRLKRIGRQRLVAMLAGRSEFKHDVSMSSLSIAFNH